VIADKMFFYDKLYAKQRKTCILSAAFHGN